MRAAGCGNRKSAQISKQIIRRFVRRSAQKPEEAGTDAEIAEKTAGAQDMIMRKICASMPIRVAAAAGRQSRDVAERVGQTDASLKNARRSEKTAAVLCITSFISVR